MTLADLLRRKRELFVGNLPRGVTAEQLRQHVEQIGVHVEDVSIKRDKFGLPVYGFVELAAQGEVEKALLQLPTRLRLDRPLRVQRPRQQQR